MKVKMGIVQIFSIYDGKQNLSSEYGILHDILATLLRQGYHLFMDN